MGKVQSKRSVDITTEVNKEGNAVDEGTGKMGKIDDVDQLKPQLNGDTNHKDAELTDNEKKVEKDETENEKDIATEKGQQNETAAVENGDGATKVTETSADAKNDTNKAAAPVENGNGVENEADVTTTTLDDSKLSEVAEAQEEIGDTSTPNTDSNKKPKKEKTKKRWSFRSFSFSKKDKQKPTKKGADDANATAPAATNGECEKVLEETPEEAVPAAEKPSDEAAVEKSNEVPAPATNGTSDENKSVEAKVEETPAAAAVVDEKPAAVVAEPVVEDKKPTEDIKQVAEETIEEAIIAASKSVDEKINVVVKPEENGFDKSPEKPAEVSATESVNGDAGHKTIDEIVPSPEKLEKVAAAIQPTSTEVVTAE